MTTKSFRRWGTYFVFFVFGLPILLIAYTNCAPGFKVDESGTSNFQSNSPPPVYDDGAINELPINTMISSKNVIRNGETIAAEDPNCMNNNNWDACVIWKNPAVRGTYSGKLTVGTNLSSVQTLGVKLRNRLDIRSLKSRSQQVVLSAFSPLTEEGELPYSWLTLPASGQLKKAYAVDHTNTGPSESENNYFSLAQLQAYYWINHMEEELKFRTRATNPKVTNYYNLPGARSGIFWASNKNVFVNAFITLGEHSELTCADALICNNAFFIPVSADGNQGEVYLGYIADSAANTYKHEVGLSGEVAIHEMGHANLWHARNMRAYNDGIQINGGTFCLFTEGCLSAIDEGQADFHAIMLFPESPGVGESFTSNKAPFRNVRALEGMKLTGNGTADFEEYRPPTLQDGQRYGAIHSLGEFYSSILWEIYKDNRIDKRAFEATFLYHLRLLGDTATFAASWDALASTDENFFEGRNKAVIDEVFTRKGVSR